MKFIVGSAGGKPSDCDVGLTCEKEMAEGERTEEAELQSVVGPTVSARASEPQLPTRGDPAGLQCPSGKTPCCSG